MSKQEREDGRKPEITALGERKLELTRTKKYDREGEGKPTERNRRALNRNVEGRSRFYFRERIA